jgi:hypothetical protein
MEAGYKNVISSLEKVMMTPEMMSPRAWRETKLLNLITGYGEN